MARTSRQYEMLQEALKGNKNNNTTTTYTRHIKEFASWERESYGKKFDRQDYEVNKGHVQAYEKYLEEGGFSASTIHTKVAAICKGLKIPMQDIEKPKRTIGTLTKDRNIEANKRGKDEMMNSKFEKSVTLSRAVGIRRSELGHLTKESLTIDESGYMCIEVLRGKGGKYQLQRILPQYQEVVKKIFDEAKPGKKIFEPEELKNHISYHSLRAEVAKEAYNYYKNIIDNGGREKLINELSERFKAHHRKDGQYSEKAYNRFMSELTKDNYEYKLRGESKQLAFKNGKPIILDRVAIMAVSVFHLSHWRSGVAIVNYLSK